MCCSVSACIRHMFLVAPSCQLKSIATVHGTRSKHPVVSLSNVANVVLVVSVMLYVSSFNINASSACQCGRPPH